MNILVDIAIVRLMWDEDYSRRYDVILILNVWILKLGYSISAYYDDKVYASFKSLL